MDGVDHSCVPWDWPCRLNTTGTPSSSQKKKRRCLYGFHNPSDMLTALFTRRICTEEKNKHTEMADAPYITLRSCISVLLNSPF